MNIAKRFLLVLIISTSISQIVFSQEKHIEVVKITDSVYVFKPKIDWVHSNCVAIIGKDAVFIIDTFQATNYAEEAIEALGKITKLPVAYVLNTHWHYDHVVGNYAFRKAYPSAKFVMHDATYKQMARSVKNFIEQEAKSINDFTPLENDLKNGKTNEGVLITGKMKEFWEWQLQEAKDYARSYKGNQLVNGDITFTDSLTFSWGSQTIKLIHASDNGHTKGDVIAWIPQKKIVITGDIVVAPTPYATYTNIQGLMKSLQRIIDMKPAIIIPGHGEVQHDVSYAQLEKDAIAAYILETEKALNNKWTRSEAMLKLTVPEIDIKFTHDDVVKDWAYRSFFTHWIVHHVYKANGILPNK